jgi:hypothetical protein
MTTPSDGAAPDGPTPNRSVPDEAAAPSAGRPDSEPPADPLAAGGDDNARDAPLLSRRSALFGALGLAAVALAGGGFAVGRLLSPTPGPVANTATPLLTSETLKISHGGGICDGPLYAAAHNGFFTPSPKKVAGTYSGAGETLQGLIAATVKKDSGLAQPLADAINHLIKNGQYAQWLQAWGLSDEAVPTSEVNPPGLPITNT